MKHFCFLAILISFKRVKMNTAIYNFVSWLFLYLYTQSGECIMMTVSVFVQVPEHSVGDSSRERLKQFTYDHSYWTVNRSSPQYVSQEQVLIHKYICLETSVHSLKILNWLTVGHFKYNVFIIKFDSFGTLSSAFLN